MNRLKLATMIVVAVCMSGFMARPTAAIDININARGSYVDDVTQEADTWEAAMLAEAQGLGGYIALFGASDAATVEVDGTIEQGRIRFEFTTPTGEQGVFTGRITGSRISGTYTVEDRHGTWTGVWHPDLPRDALGDIVS